MFTLANVNRAITITSLGECFFISFFLKSFSIDLRAIRLNGLAKKNITVCT